MSLLTQSEQDILRLLDPLRRHLESTLAPVLLSKFSVEDVIQETFIRASRGLESVTFENDAMRFAWLKKIASNVSISLIRKREVTIVSQPSSNDLGQILFDSGDLSPSKLVSIDENRQLLALAIAKLPENHQFVIRRRYHDQFAFEQIADELETTAGAVRGLHRNALESLRRCLGEMACYLSSR
jgi:RNA polymerase sigma-70 factor (ECF subfamily)